MTHIYGITLDNPWDTAAIAAKLDLLPGKIWVRVVFDRECKASEYTGVLRLLKPHVAGIMGELLDSEEFLDKDGNETFTVDAYRNRAIDYYERLKDFVDVWEVGNEINGDWLGEAPWEKVIAAHKYIKDRGGKTALTFYDNAPDETNTETGWELYTAAYLPQEMRDQVDWVLMSSYPHDNDGYESQWNDVLVGMSEWFPNSEYGIGECGQDPEKFQEQSRRDCFYHYYSDINTRPYLRFMGGYFYWYQDDILNGPLFEDLKAVLT